VTSEADIDELVEQAEIVRDMFGKMISDACGKLANKLEDDNDISVHAFILGVEWGAMTFAATCARLHDSSKESFMNLAAETFDEEPAQTFSVTTVKQKAH
jgi:hypothetical protein